MWGCACAVAVATTRPANAAAAQKKKRQIIDLLAKATLLARQISRARRRTISRTAAEWRREMPLRRRGKVTRNLRPRGAAVGTRVMAAFARSIRMQHHRPGMAHDVRIRFRQHLHVVTGRQQAVDERAVEARFHAQIAARRAPGAPQQPARGVDRADRKSTRLNSSHLGISYAVFC